MKDMRKVNEHREYVNDIADDCARELSYNGLDVKVYNSCKYGFLEGYEQAEKDLAPAFEFPFYVPDDDGFIVFTPMDNQTIRREPKLKKGERVIVSIRKEHEKE